MTRKEMEMYIDMIFESLSLTSKNEKEEKNKKAN